ncbi:MAG TPA: M56 family metallopeptidase [Blastocatellia bacterium]|nr:M56 family metallopeptidase [Blastocatellia bacterium]
MTGYPSVAAYAISLAVNLTVIGAFFIAGITLAFRSLGAASARARYVIALAVFLISALLPTVVTFGQSGEATHSSAVAATVRTEQGPGTVGSSHDPPAGIGSLAQNEEACGVHSSAERLGSTEMSKGVPVLDGLVSAAALSRFGAAFPAVWAIISSLLVAREVAGHIRLARERSSWRLADDKTRRSLAWPAGTTLYVSQGEGPCTLGGLRPAVVIPALLLEDMPGDAARVIARHELAHARWRDPLANALLRIGRALLWPSLPLWYLERLVRAEREVAADQFAIEPLRGSTVGDAAVEYATLLLSIARRSGQDAHRLRYGLVATEAGSGTNFEYRVRHLLTPRSKLTRARVLFAAVAMLLCACGAAFAPVTARPLSIASLPVEDPPAADLSATEGDTIKAGAQQVEEGLRQRKAEAMAGAGEQSMSTAYPQQGMAGGNELGVVSRIRLDAQNEAGATQDLVHELADLGYSGLSPEQIAAAKAYGVSRAYVEELASAGYDRLAADTLINLRSLGVSPAYIKEMRQMGYGDLPANTLIDFRLYGINSAYLGELATSGFSHIPAKALVTFRSMGINGEYIHALQSTVTGSLSPDELLALRRQGVTVGYLKELKAKGYGRLTVDQLIELRSGKVTGGES